MSESEIIDEDHERMRRDGWSWIGLMNGPRDGTRKYFKGSPPWTITFVDPSVDAATYKPGDLEHRYSLKCGYNDRAVYVWDGIFTRGEQINDEPDDMP